MTSFDLHVHDMTLNPEGLLHLYLPPSTLHENLTTRLTQLYQIQLLYLFVSDAVNIVSSTVSCSVVSPQPYQQGQEEKGILHANFYNNVDDLVFDFRKLLHRYVIVKTQRQGPHQHLSLTNRLDHVVKVRVSTRLAWILGLTFTNRQEKGAELEFILQARETLIGPFPINLWRGGHFAHLLSLDNILRPPTHVYCTACLKQDRTASSLASLIWETSPRQPSTVFGRQLKHAQGVTGHLTKQNFTLALLDGEQKPFPSGALTGVSAGFKFTLLDNTHVNQATTG